MDLVIRPFEPEDRDSVIQLWNRAFPNYTGHNDPGRSIDRKVAHQDGLFFVAILDGDLVGTVMAGYDGHRGWIYSLAIDSPFRRRGIGTRLVRHIEAEFCNLDCRKVNLQVLPDNAQVIGFYESLGYSVEQRISMGKRFDDR